MKRKSKNNNLAILIGLLIMLAIIGGLSQFTSITEDTAAIKTLTTGQSLSFGETTIKVDRLDFTRWSPTASIYKAVYTYSLNGNQIDTKDIILARPITTSYPDSNIIITKNNIQYKLSPNGIDTYSTNSPSNTIFCSLFYAKDLYDKDKSTQSYTMSGCSGQSALKIETTLLKTDYNISIESTDTLFTNQDYDMIINVDSFESFDGYLEITYSFNSPLIPKITNIINTTFVKGANQIKIKVPTQVEAKLDISVKAGAYLPSNEISTKIWTKTANKFILVNPKPIYLPLTETLTDCAGLEGYILSYDKKYCIRNDLNTLSCNQVGCPSFPDNPDIQYECSSDGYCTQFVTKYIDREVVVVKEVVVINNTETIVEKEVPISLESCNTLCEQENNAVCKQNDNGDYYCVAKEIAEVIVELPTPVYITKSCADFDICGDEYTCKDFIIEGQPQATCVKETIINNTITKIVKNNQWIYVFGIIGITILISIIIIKRKR